jgi:hypothetical protein
MGKQYNQTRQKEADRQETDCDVAFPITSPILPFGLYRRFQSCLPKTPSRSIDIHSRISGPADMGQHSQSDGYGSRNGRSWDLSYSARGIEVFGSRRSRGWVQHPQRGAHVLTDSQSSLRFLIPRVLPGDIAGVSGGCD